MAKIIVNGMFVGSYGTNDKNLPHEVINIYRADDGNCYVYISPYGSFPHKVSADDVSTRILFVHSVGNGLMEIVAKAKGIQKVYTADLALNGNRTEVRNMPDSHNSESSEYILDKITYGGCPLDKLHAKNADDINIFITCKVEKIYLPTKTCYITTNTVKEKYCALKNQVYVVNTDRRINNSAMTITFDDGDSGYNDLDKVLNDDNIWGNAVTKFNLNNSNISDCNNFFRITMQQNNEVMFSNALCYMLNSSKTILQNFVRECLGLKECACIDNCVVEREDNRIDISIKQDNFYIIIENKIKSGINGIKKQKEGEPALIKSQLSKYYEVACKKMGDDSKIHCFLLHANYDSFELQGYECGEKYTQITYKDLSTFFSGIEKNRETYEDFFNNSISGKLNESFLREFVKALKKHTCSVDNEFKDDMLRRMSLRINEYNTSK